MHGERNQDRGIRDSSDAYSLRKESILSSTGHHLSKFPRRHLQGGHRTLADTLSTAAKPLDDKSRKCWRALGHKLHESGWIWGRGVECVIKNQEANIGGRGKEDMEFLVHWLQHWGIAVTYGGARAREQNSTHIVQEEPSPLLG